MKPLACPYGLDTFPEVGDSAIAGTLPTDPVTLRELECELEKNRRFASDAAHELRTPIAGLRAELEEAQLHPGQTDLAGLLGRALSDVDRLEMILTDLRLQAKLEAGPPLPPEHVDLAELVETGVSRRRDRLTVELQLEPAVTVNAVSTQIDRVLTNLLDNAQRHAEHTVRVQVSRDGDAAELAVTDDGDGIAEAHRKRVFQPFTRLEAARRRDDNGTGLGLAISLDIARGHGGSLDIEDAPSGGARFVLRLPLAAPSSPPGPTATDLPPADTARCRNHQRKTGVTSKAVT
jgi:signal transduction histidine kinase